MPPVELSAPVALIDPARIGALAPGCPPLGWGRVMLVIVGGSRDAAMEDDGTTGTVLVERTVGMSILGKIK